MKTYIPTRHIQNEDTHEVIQTNKTHTEEDAQYHTNQQGTYRMKRHMNIHKPTIHTEEDTHEDIHTNNTHRGRDT